VRVASKAALSHRYTLLNYLYTSFFYSTMTGSPVMRPLFFAAPEDEVARNTSSQWMLGDSLIAAPVVSSPVPRPNKEKPV
jgi:alpha-glucosidase (family GH31 glycosyl hydrolase)